MTTTGYKFVESTFASLKASNSVPTTLRHGPIFIAYYFDKCQEQANTQGTLAAAIFYLLAKRGLETLGRWEELTSKLAGLAAPKTPSQCTYAFFFQALHTVYCPADQMMSGFETFIQNDYAEAETITIRHMIGTVVSLLQLTPIHSHRFLSIVRSILIANESTLGKTTMDVADSLLAQINPVMDGDAATNLRENYAALLQKCLQWDGRTGVKPTTSTLIKFTVRPPHTTSPTTEKPTEGEEGASQALLNLKSCLKSSTETSTNNELRALQLALQQQQEELAALKRDRITVAAVGSDQGPPPKRARFEERESSRGTPTTPCYTCGEMHWHSACPHRQGSMAPRGSGSFSMRSPPRCYQCNQIGHIQRFCPSNMQFSSAGSTADRHYPSAPVSQATTAAVIPQAPRRVMVVNPTTGAVEEFDEALWQQLDQMKRLQSYINPPAATPTTGVPSGPTLQGPTHRG
jgi:hypothetical protein